jgi:hypothetical protein
MGSKNNPGKFDCYANAMPDEPMFILLARDPFAPELVVAWADQRHTDIVNGRRGETDIPMIEEALACARAMADWRIANDGKWRDHCPSPTERVSVSRELLERVLDNARKDSEALQESEPRTRDQHEEFRADRRLIDALLADARSTDSGTLLAVEFGYRACEKGMNLQQALKEAQGAK